MQVSYFEDIFKNMFIKRRMTNDKSYLSKFVLSSMLQNEIAKIDHMNI